jgi:hypothetical protein
VDDAQRVRSGLNAVMSQRGSPRDIADRLCLACVDLLGVDGAAVSVIHDGATHGTFGSSGDLSRHLDELQFTFGEGPCLDAVLEGQPVMAPDLRDRDENRWPTFAGAAMERGVHAVFALPVSLARSRVGALDLFRRKGGQLTAEALAGGLLAARLAAQPLADHMVAAAGSGNGPAGWDGLDRVEVYQATGMIMACWQLTPAAAVARLRAHAFALGITASALAWAVVERRLVLSPDGEWPPSCDVFPGGG